MSAGTQLAEVLSLVTEQHKAELEGRLVAYLANIEAAFERRDRIGHARESLALLMYTRGIPVFLLEPRLDVFMRRVEERGAEPYLSFYIDLGRRLACSRTASSKRRYGAMLEAFTRQPPPRFGSQVVFLRAGCHWRSAVEAFSDNVGWSVASLVFSDFGRNLMMYGPVGLDTFLQLAEFGTECATCEDEEAEGSGAPTILAGGASAADSGSIRIRDLAGSLPTSAGASASACTVLNAGLALGMDDGTQSTFCRATNDLRGGGFGSLGQDCFDALNGVVDNPMPASDTLMETLDRFQRYIACQNRAFDRRTNDGFYTELSQYFEGVPATNGSCEVKEGLKWCKYDDDQDGHAEAYEIRDEKGNLEGLSELKPAEQSKVDPKATFREEQHYLPERRSKESLSTPDGNYTKEVTVAPDGTEQVKFTKHTDDGPVEVSEDEYEAVKEKYFPPSPNVQPSPDQPMSPCDRILDDGGMSEIRTQDIGELIQFAPDDVLEAGFASLQQCLQNLDGLGRCHTQMVCVDERGDLDCTCDALVGGPIGQTDQCPYIQCAEGATAVNCMCQQSDGGFIPGLQGPLFFPVVPGVGVSSGVPEIVYTPTSPGGGGEVPEPSAPSRP